MKTHTGKVFGSRVSVAIASVTVTAVVVAGGLALALPGTRTVEKDDLQTQAVNSRVIQNRTIAPWDMSDGAVRTRQLSDDAVTSDKLADDSVTAAAIADDAVKGAAINDNAVRTQHLRKDAVTTPKLAANAVTSAKIANRTITSSDLAAGVIPQPLWAKDRRQRSRRRSADGDRRDPGHQREPLRCRPLRSHVLTHSRQLWMDRDTQRRERIPG